MDAQHTEHDDHEPGKLLDGWLSRSEVAAAIGVSIDTLQRWQSRRIGPPLVRIGRQVFYRADAFREWLVDQERGPTVLKNARRGGAR